MLDKKRIYAGIIALVMGIVLMASGCGNMGKTMNTTTLFAMDTVMEIQIAGSEELLSEAEQRIRDIEKKVSVTDKDSEIYKLNDECGAKLSEDTAKIMDGALKMCDKTDGALDITIYPVLREWGFTTGEYKVPDETRLEELLEYVDYSKVKLSFDGRLIADDASGYISGEAENAGESVACCSIPENTKVDLGSVTKGYTSGVLSDFFKEKGVKSGLINLGGNVQCIGSKSNGQPWNVAIKSPFKDSDSKIFGVLKASDVAVITSGGYERFFEEAGETYWHILDPKTGRPARNGLVSVTIVGKDALKCDALSTALFVKGLDGAIDFYRNNDDFDIILITEDGETYISDGIADSFSLSSEYYDTSLHVVSR